jgi:peroxiredoxin
MKRILILLIVCLALLVRCASPNTNEHNKKISENELEGLQQKTKDTTYEKYLIDTSLRFSSFKELFIYRLNSEKLFTDFKKDIESKSPENSRLFFTNDSIKYLNQDFFTYLIFKHFRNNEKSMQNIYLLLYNIDFSNLISLQERIDLYNSFPPEIRNSLEGKKVYQKINESSYNDNLGLNFSELKPFKLTDTSGNKHNLSDLLAPKYEYALIIFSASWCAPCRYESLFMKNEIHKIDTSRMKLITISIDKDKKKWMKAIKDDDCPWSQLLSEGEFESDLIKTLKITSIPRNILVNRKKEIIAEHTNINVILAQLQYIYVQ